MNDGLREKYIVRKAGTGEIVENCFVLRPEKDPAAIAAIRAYAAATNNPVLSADLLRWVGPLPNDPLTLDELREMDGEPVWVVSQDGRNESCWMLVDVEYELCREAHSGMAVFENYGKTWLAYRHRPEEV